MDEGNLAAERELLSRYPDDDRLRPGPHVRSFAPNGGSYDVDLSARTTRPVEEREASPDRSAAPNRRLGGSAPRGAVQRTGGFALGLHCIATRCCQPLPPGRSAGPVVGTEVMARVEVTKGAERGHGDEPSRSTGGLPPGVGELADVEHLGPTEVWGPGVRAGLDQIGESSSDLTGVDDLEREVRCPNEDAPAQELIEEVVKLCRSLDGPPHTRRLDHPLGFPLRLVVREPVAVDSDDRDVDEVYGAPGMADGVEDVPGTEYLGLACVPARTGSGVNDCIDASHGRVQPFTGADIPPERLHLVAITGGTACQQPDCVTSLDQQRHEPASEHPGAAGHEYPHHRGHPILRRNAPNAE